MAEAKPKNLIVLEDLEIESHRFNAGDTIAQLRAGKIVPTAAGVEVGHVMARMNLGLVGEANTPASQASLAESSATQKAQEAQRALGKNAAGAPRGAAAGSA